MSNTPWSQARVIRGACGLLLCILAAGVRLAVAQTSTATLTGTVVDVTAAALGNADLTLTAVATSKVTQLRSAANGGFVFTGVLPGRYVLRASYIGFASTEIGDLLLNAGDRIVLRVELTPAAQGESLVVRGEARTINTAPALSTVVDRQFVENLPLNGRSLQSLFELTAGVVIVPVRNSSQEGGQFSVNGQRSNANYFTVDGVSAASGLSSGDILFGAPGQSGAGSLPALTALGGTNGLVSVDALEEFRIHTSGYAPEFGRMPGGQVSLVTRSGTNKFRGNISEYFRDEAMDANDWFLNRAGLAKPELSQHDFGGVVGGPLMRDRAFFFISYEGLRLIQPRALTANTPTLQARLTAAPFLRPFVEAFPLPNGAERSDGTADFTAGYSDPSRFDSYSGRVDYRAGAMTLFARTSITPSYARNRSFGTPSSVSTVHADNKSMTVGSTWTLSRSMIHDLRANYSTTSSPMTFELDDFGGAIVPSESTAFFRAGRDPSNSAFQFTLSAVGGLRWGLYTGNKQRQLNIVDTFTVNSGDHEIKAGVDFRRSTPVLGGDDLQTDLLSVSRANLPRGIGTYQMFARDSGRVVGAFNNISLFTQDTWRMSARLTATYGLRWEFVPPPYSVEGEEPITLDNLDSPYGGQVKLAPRGTDLWEKRFNNIAPRLGVSYVVSERPGAQLVVKGAWGRFYDLGLGVIANTFRSYPFQNGAAYSNVDLANAPASLAALPIPNATTPPFQIYVMDRELELPLTYQWNLSIEQGLGASQKISVAYAGAEGRKQVKLDGYTIALLDWPTDPRRINVNKNQGYSSYKSLQVQYQRRLHRGWQSLVSYTLGSSRDTSSSDAISGVPVERVPPSLDYGYSDYDVRHSFAAALTWRSPELIPDSLVRSIASDWSVDVMLRARSGFPVDIRATVPFPPDQESVRPDAMPGQSFWLDDASAPAGRRLNPGAFAVPSPGNQGSLPRGAVRGFSAHQVDLAIHREIRLFDHLRVQLRGEMFNLLNTPHFGDPNAVVSSAIFGLSRQMLSASLGGLNSTYQLGGPRSTQLAVKILF